MTNFHIVINHGFYIFEQNFIDFEKTTDNYVKELYDQGITSFDMRNRHYQSERFKFIQKEITRFLHNYLASRYTLKDQTQSETKSLDSSLENDSLRTDIKNKITEIFENNVEDGIIKNLRNYTQHKTLPLVFCKSSLSFEFNQPDFDIKHSLYLDVNKLLEWDKWNENEKNYLNNQKGTLVITEIIRNDYLRMKIYYQWLKSRINGSDKSQDDIVQTEINC